MPTRVMARSLMVALALALCSAIGLAADDPPVVVAVDPDEPTTPYVESIDIYGANFIAPIKVEFGGHESPSSKLLTPGRIRSQVPYGFGNVDIVVTSGPDQEKALFERGIPSITPVIDRLEPHAARAGDQVTVYGRDLFPDSAQSIKFGSASASIVSQTPDQVVVQVPTGSGTVNFSLSNADGKTSVMEGGFTYLPFVGAGISPAVARIGNYVTITGEGFLDTRS
ncbi:MAG: IPT/TIG domain-containing protein, partial [Planctomycetota bacterium]